MTSIPNLAKPAIDWDIPKRVFVKENIINDDMCSELINFGNSNVQKGINKYPGSFGISFHACLIPLDHKVHGLLQTTLNEAIEHFKFDISFIEPYELKRYTLNDFFGKHTDNYYSLTKDVDRKLTMSVQLTDSNEYTGGELTVVGKDLSAKSKGSVTIFPSNFPHEVKSITSGIRWSLIGWAWGPYWK